MVSCSVWSVLPEEMIIKVSEQLNKTELNNFLEAIPNLVAVISRSRIGFFIDTTRDYKIRTTLIKRDKSLDALELVQLVNSPPVELESGDSVTHPSLVKMLWIHHPISETKLRSLTSNLGNIQHLKISVATLDIVSFQNQTLNFPKLKDFMIFAPNLGDPLIDKTLKNVPLILNNVILILGSANHPELERLSLDIPYIQSSEGTIVAAVIGSLLKHKTTLKKFLLNFQGNWKIPNSEPMSDQSYLEPSNLGHAIDGLALTDIGIRCRNNSPQSKNMFYNILTNTKQRRLSHIYFETSKYPTFPTNLILDNSITLVSLEMDISVDTIGGIISCLIFSVCTSLKILSLVADPSPHMENLQRQPEFIETNFLPESLECLRICHLHIEKDEVNKITANLINLKLLELQDIGEVENLGLSVEALNDILIKRKVVRVSIFEGFNKESFLNPGNNYFKDVALLALETDICLTFYLRNGEYELCQGSHHPNITRGQFIDLGFQNEYRLHHPYRPFQLDGHEYDTGGMEVDEDEEIENEDETENEEQEEGGEEEQDDDEEEQDDDEEEQDDDKEEQDDDKEEQDDDEEEQDDDEEEQDDDEEEQDDDEEEQDDDEEEQDDDEEGQEDDEEEQEDEEEAEYWDW